MLDVGAGDGLIAFTVKSGRCRCSNVASSDISVISSRSLNIATKLSTADRIDRPGAARTRYITDASVDVVTTRSVLIYVNDKASAFQAFHRVLKPGGRLSIFEPINNYFPDSIDEFWGFDARPVGDLVAKVWEYEGWVESSYANDPMMNFTEKDLLRHAEEAGFRDVHGELRVDVEPGTWVVDWERLLNTSPNPNARTAGEALRGALTEDEFARFEEHLRPLADSGRGVLRSAFAYIWAVK